MSDRRGQLLFVFAPPATLILLSVITLAAGGLPEFMAPWPFLIAICVIGLPHGAIDFILTQRLDGTSVATTVIRFGWYLAVMICVVTSLFLLPLPVMIAFGLLSAWHFGQADAEDLDDISPMSADKAIPKANWAFARGFIVVLLPFVFFFESSVDVLNQLLAFCGSTKLNATSEWRMNIAAFLVGCFVLELASILRSVFEGNRLRAGVESFEVIALVVCFGTLHPLFASGVYFLTWHSWRHLRRLNRILNHRSLWSFNLHDIVSLHRDSLILLIPTVVTVPLIAIRLGGDMTPLNLCLSSLLVYVIVTLPHELLCGRLFASLSAGDSARRNLGWSSRPLAESHLNDPVRVGFGNIPKSKSR